MTDTLAIALAQVNPTVGDVAGNLDRIRAARAEAAGQGADLVVFSELCVSGYPPEDLVLKPAFQEACEAGVRALAEEAREGPGIILGTPWRNGNKLHNAVVLLDQGEVRAIRFKHDLPNYGPFDEKRVFAAGPCPGPMVFRDVRLGVMVCEDMWTPDVAETLQESGAEILVVVNGSPFELGKTDVRLNLAVERVIECERPLIYVNQVGGQDELVFDGASFVLGADRSLRAQAKSFAEDVLTTRWRRESEEWICEPAAIAPLPERLEAIYSAMTLGLRDYVNKNRFPGVILGLSGGIDSALSAAVAVDALGAEKVHCVMMPSPYTSQESLDDAAEMARRVGVEYRTILITPAMQAFDAMLKDAFAGRPADITEENIQSRARGVVLMALSNKFGHMVLTTGNKSEMSTGYATLYGDMAGGYSVLKDVYKTTVFELSRWRNAHRPPGALGPAGEVIPQRIIEKPPSAELKPNQTDQDTLPPYEVLDDILRSFIEGEQSRAQVAARGHSMEVVQKVWRMLDRAEYKRRQAPPGVKITARSFGRDRRYPITNGFTDQG